jgi:hypothetical protein
MCNNLSNLVHYEQTRFKIYSERKESIQSVDTIQLFESAMCCRRSQYPFIAIRRR